MYVRSQKAGERVLAGLRKHYGRLHLKVNDAKTAVASAYGQKFLGYCLWAAPRDDDVSGVAGVGGEFSAGGQGGRQRTLLVAQQPAGTEPPPAHCLIRPARRAPALMISTSRTARCGPACRVVWEGRGKY